MKKIMRNVECRMRNDAKRHKALPLFSIVTLFIVLALAFSACTSDSFNKRTVIPEAEWHQENRIAFDADIHTRMPNGNVTHDTIECT